MLVFSLAGAPLSISQDATWAVNLLYYCSPRTPVITNDGDDNFFNFTDQIGVPFVFPVFAHEHFAGYERNA